MHLLLLVFASGNVIKLKDLPTRLSSTRNKTGPVQAEIPRLRVRLSLLTLPAQDRQCAYDGKQRLNWSSIKNVPDQIIVREITVLINCDDETSLVAQLRPSWSVFPDMSDDDAVGLSGS